MIDRLNAALAFIYNPDHIAQVAALRKRDNDQARAYSKARRARSKTFRLLGSLRCRIRAALKVSGTRKLIRTHRLLGCTVQQACDHLQSLFQPGMTWENYGQWEIDHIKPCKLFNLRFPSQQRLCFHFSNLQPLWMRDNRSKQGRYCPEMQRKAAQKQA